MNMFEKTTITPKKIAAFLKGELPSNKSFGRIVFTDAEATSKEVKIKTAEKDLLLFFYIDGKIINETSPEKLNVREIWDADCIYDSFFEKACKKMEEYISQ